jgi:hypothetical protein
LYPVENKNYTRSTPIRRAWREVQEALERAFLLTVFGYSAPLTDIEAKRPLSEPWARNRLWDSLHIEIIDIKETEEVVRSWSEMIPHDHFLHERSFSSSWLGRHPRRSCAAKYEASIMGLPPASSPFPQARSLHELHQAVQQLP